MWRTRLAQFRAPDGAGSRVARATVTQAGKGAGRRPGRKYLAGSADFLVVTDAQRALSYTARDQLRRTSAGGRLAASVWPLFKALGGGFNIAARPHSPQ